MLSHCALLTVACAVALSCAAPAAAAAVCGIPVDGIDFSSLSNTDFEGSDGVATSTYYLRVCGILHSSANCIALSSNSSACLSATGQQYQTIDLGDWNGAPVSDFTWLDANYDAVTYTMTGAQQCWAEGAEAKYYTTQVILRCADKQGPMTVADPHPLSCTKVFSLPTPLACRRQPPPPAPVQCGIDGLDFSSLRYSDIPGFDGFPLHSYYLNVCGSVKSAAAANCRALSSSTSACAIQQGEGYQTFDLGDWDSSSPPVFSYVGESKSKVTYSMTGAAQCWTSSGVAVPYVTQVILDCSNQLGPLTVSTEDECTKIFYLPTPLACPSGSSSSSSSSERKHRHSHSKLAALKHKQH